MLIINKRFTLFKRKRNSAMFFFGTKKDKYYDVAQKLFTALADAAPEGWKQQILMQRDLMKKAKLCNSDTALVLFFRHLPEETRPDVSIVLEESFASIRLKKAEKDFYADFNIGSDGTICAIQFTYFPKDCAFDVSDVDFYPEILGKVSIPKKQDAAFRISEKLVSILGPEWDREFPPPESPAADEDDEDSSPDYAPALPPEIREQYARRTHTELPDDWQEFSKYFSELDYHGSTVYGCTDEMQLIPMHPGDAAMYLVARIMNGDSDIGESYVLASSDKTKWNTLYYLTDYEGGEADCIPIGTDLFGFLRKAEDSDYLKSLKKD